MDSLLSRLLAWDILFIYKFVTDKLMPIIGETNVILIALIDRIRMLDNDLIRLNQKVNVVLQIKEDHSDYKPKD
jgi:hypothetical protein